MRLPYKSLKVLFMESMEIEVPKKLAGKALKDLEEALKRMMEKLIYSEVKKELN